MWAKDGFHFNAYGKRYVSKGYHWVGYYSKFYYICRWKGFQGNTRLLFIGNFVSYYLSKRFRCYTWFLANCRSPTLFWAYRRYANSLEGLLSWLVLWILKRKVLHKFLLVRCLHRWTQIHSCWLWVTKHNERCNSIWVLWSWKIFKSSTVPRPRSTISG